MTKRLIVWMAAVALASIVVQVRPRGAGCDPVGNLRFVCGLAGPEDLAIVPGGKWVLASGMAQSGGIRLIDLKDKSATVLFPGASPKEQLDQAAYGTCPGPAKHDDFRSHGLYLRSTGNQQYRLFAVHHGDRESVEVFTLDTRGSAPTLTWIGCAVAPDPVGLNSVVGLPDGGLVATNFQPRNADAAGRGRMMTGENNGELWEWHPRGEWKKVPGSEAAGPNGLEISPDGKTLYIGGWGSQTLIRLSRGENPPKKDTVNVGFRVDNVRWAPDGMLLATGQLPAAQQGQRGSSHSARVDPKTLKAEEVLNRPDDDAFATATVAVQIGQELWVGSVRGDRVAIMPVRPKS
jgi:hypothetical protein